MRLTVYVLYVFFVKLVRRGSKGLTSVTSRAAPEACILAASHAEGAFPSHAGWHLCVPAARFNSGAWYLQSRQLQPTLTRRTCSRGIGL